MTLRRFLPCLLPICLLSSCAVGPNYQAPETTVDASFANLKKGGYTSSGTVDDWWNRFNDSKLNSLIDRAIANNHDLKIASARVEEARALRKAAKYDYFPTITSSADYINTTVTKKQAQVKVPPSLGVDPSTGALTTIPGRTIDGDRTSEIYDAGVNAYWELDIWGRVRRTNWAARADLESVEATRHFAMVSLLSEVASNYLELRGLQNQLGVALRNAENQKQTLKLTESLLQGGRGTELDTSRARAQLNNTLATIPTLESAVSRNIYRLSVLVGEQPDRLTPELKPVRPMPKLPSLVRIGNPSELLRRRPDIRAAEKDLESATHRVGIAVADLFPRVTFNGNASLQSSSFSGLYGGGAGRGSFGPSISWAALDSGRVLMQVKANQARVKNHLAFYEKTVLQALEETEGSLNRYGHLKARSNYLAQAASASEQAADLARERYQNGVADFLTVLDAERTLLEAQSLLADSQTATATAVVAIYRALGGGWENGGVTVKK